MRRPTSAAGEALSATKWKYPLVSYEPGTLREVLPMIVAARSTEIVEDTCRGLRPIPGSVWRA